MRKYLIHIVLIIGCFQVLNIKAQDSYPAEKALMWTDRAVFISGETIHFAGNIQINGDFDLLSTVIYIELISPANQKISQIKRPIDKGFFEGVIQIPPDVLSGYYYLRAYTKWMRNGPPQNYEYLMIKIINPYQNDVLPIEDSLVLIHGIPPLQFQGDTCTEKQFSRKEALDLKQICMDHQLKSYSISFIPEGTQAFIIDQAKDLSSYTQVQSYPETRGVSISGKVFVKDEVAPYHKINVHLMGEKDFIAVLCDSVGRFNVALPKAYQEQELFLIAASTKKGKVSIQIDQDFCNEEIRIHSPKFSLEPTERALLLSMAQNHQIVQAFSKDEKIELLSDEGIPFYGSVFKTLIMDFYVPLDSLELYFTDIPSGVTVKRKKKKRYLQMMGDRIELTMFPTLLLVDWVPVDDANRVLSMNPSLVEKIDIIDQIYLHGDDIYGGIIHVQTYKGDFGNLKFPETGQYLNYKFYDPRSSKPRTPQAFDNTQLWKTAHENKEDMKIQVPPRSGSYFILIQGINKQGVLERQLQRIQVK